MPIRNWKDYKKEQKSPFDSDKNYKGGNFTSAGTDKLGRPKVKCNKCGNTFAVRKQTLLNQGPVHCKCGNK